MFKPQAAKHMFYNKILAKFLKTTPSGEMLMYFADQAWNLWASNLKQEDYQNIELIEWICLSLKDTNEEGLALVLSETLKRLHDVRLISDECFEEVDELTDKSPLEKRYKAYFEAYKGLYESDFRLWGTIPYLYVCEKIIKGKKKLAKYEDYLEVGSSEKLETLRSIKIDLPKGKIRSLVVGFDNKLRNASSGHNRWEITDDETVILKDVNPKTGAIREEKEMTLKEIREKLRLIKGKILILELGLMVFITNYPNIKEKFTYRPKMKIREIERHIRAHTETLQINIEKFEFDRKHLVIELKKELIIAGEKGEIFMADGSGAEIATSKQSVSYEEQMLGVLQYIFHMNEKETFSAEVKVFDEKGEIVFDLEYLKEEIAKLVNKDEKPRPHRGNITDRKYDLIAQYPVPRGMREIVETKLKEKNETNK